MDVLGASASSVTWLDWRFDPTRPWPDAEPRGLDFVADRAAVTAWRRWWPQGGTPPSWDAVGWALVAGEPELVLVEAKAHLAELKNSCKASGASLRRIEMSLNETKHALGVDPARDWLKQHYQYANRLAVLHFLHEHGIRAHLLFIYFIGERPRRGWMCPRTEAGWRASVTAQEESLGLSQQHPLSHASHKLFLPVASQR